MKLINLDEVNELTGDIIVFGFSEKHLLEFFKAGRFDVNVLGIIEENQRHQGIKTVCGRKINVVSPDDAASLYEDGCKFLIMNDYYEEAYITVVQDVVYKLLGKEDVIIYYFLDKESRIYHDYCRKYENTPLDDVIVFRSGPHASQYVRGMDYSDNARALFEYMLRAGLNKKYRLIWLVKKPEDFVEIEEANSNVKFISFDWSVSETAEKRDEYYRAICLAKYIFMTDAYGFCRYARKDQIRVQLWHGCGFKTRTTFSRCEHRYEYNIVISEIYKKIHQEIYGLRPDQVLITGYPKVDYLFHPAEEWIEQFAIPKAKKYIFWLPTFRAPLDQLNELTEKEAEGETGLPIVGKVKELQCLNQLFEEHDAVMVIKLHPFQNKEWIHMGNDLKQNIVLLTNDDLVDAGLEINQILGHADALISDYSSAAVDYLVLDRPEAFTLDDVEVYEKSRGFVFDPIKKWLPGKELYNFDDFYQYVEDVLNGFEECAEKRRLLSGKMQKWANDCNSERVCSTFGIGNSSDC